MSAGAPLLVTERAAPDAPARAALCLTHAQRQRHRLRARLEDGRELALRLPRGSSLRDGDRLRARDGTVIAVRAASEPLSAVECAHPASLTRAAYHLGNRHVALALSEDRLCYLRDSVLDAMLRGLGLKVRAVHEPFEPEGGAYEHGHARGHGHGHGHEAGGDRPNAHAHTPDAGQPPGPDAPLAVRALLPLLRLASPALPIGAFAYSQGLEWAVHCGWVSDESSAHRWIVERLEHGQAHVDVPLLARMQRAFGEVADEERALSRALAWSTRLLAHRESRELQSEDRQLGRALARLLAALGDPGAEPLARAETTTLAAAFARAAAREGAGAEASAAAYLWSWLEAQVAAAQRALPLGQTAAQRILLAGGAAIPGALARGLALRDEEIGAASPGQAIASALHETQYARLFRS